MKKKRLALLVLAPFLLFLILSVGNVYATTYMIPLLHRRMNEYTVYVHIYQEPAWAHDAVVNAMNAWVNAQVWFRDAYFPGGKIYNLTEATGTKITVHVHFSRSNTTNCRGEAIGCAIGGQVYLVTGYGPKSALSVTILAIHEFGHILGLGHPQDIGENICDVMAPAPLACTLNSTQHFNYITTLDLYAVHVLASGTNLDQVTLPSNIPFENAPSTLTVAEFPANLAVLILTLAVSATFPVTSRNRPHEGGVSRGSRQTQERRRQRSARDLVP